MSAVPIILDCDPGHDDAIALLLALASPELELLAVTTVDGKPFAAGRPGPVFRRMWEIFQAKKPKAH